MHILRNITATVAAVNIRNTSANKILMHACKAQDESVRKSKNIYQSTVHIFQHSNIHSQFYDLLFYAYMEYNDILWYDI